MQLLLVSIRAAANTTANRMAKENFPLKYMIANILKYLLNLCNIAVIDFCVPSTQVVSFYVC